MDSRRRCIWSRIIKKCVPFIIPVDSTAAVARITQMREGVFARPHYSSEGEQIYDRDYLQIDPFGPYVTCHSKRA